MTHQVISCFEPPEREAFTDLLKEYYALMISRIEADGGEYTARCVVLGNGKTLKFSIKADA